MTAVLDPFKPFSAELHVIRRLNSSLYGAGGRNGLEAGRANSPFARFLPPAEHVTLAPLRDDVPLLDPCCGQLSAGAEVDLGVKGRQKFIDFHHVASALWVPPGFRERPQTAPNPSGICEDLSEDKAWNSRRIPDAVLRARLHGSTHPVKVQPHSLKTSTKATSHSSFPDKHTGPQDGFPSDLRQWTDKSPAVQRFRYTSATQRSYEEVGWDTKLPQRLKAPETTLEKMVDPVSERPSSTRYSSRPQLWQSIGAEWNRQQFRSRNDAKKPISFCSGCLRSGQIPLYTGTIGSENMDNIDNMDEDFHPLTLKRSIVPPYVPTARRTTIPGYTGKAVYAYSAADAAVSVPAVSSPAHSSGTIKESGSPTFGHAAPLSRMATTMTPCNPFLRPALPVLHTNTRGDIRKSR
ncbi:spermatogenesis-associated protein 48 [Siniperca chuatsi]|uniref:spermatogenesis-associated protein 48 n=1 Tax=Siniperca chuatsi TaxID=119488 RepID=UPI001CE1DCDA|nr:spermatogenesis-associated protein 48 [Siniperca chuatsi]XP_044071195.1 spermatogenesis-associated protein 48 [Siniperca chuatsi]